MAARVEVDESSKLFSTEVGSTYGSNDSVQVNIQPEYDGEIGDNNLTFFQRYRGRILMSIASYLFSYMHLGTKLLGDLEVSVTEMILFRSIVTTILSILYIHYFKLEGGILGRTEVRYLLLVRGIFGYLGLAFFMVSVTNLHLGDAIALSFTIPIFMVVIAIFYLNEIWSRYDVVSIALGVVGIIYITKPESLFGRPATLLIFSLSEPFQWDRRSVGLVAALLSTFLNAVGNVTIRVIGSRAHFMQVVLYFAATPIIPSLLICYLDPSQISLKFNGWTLWCLVFMSMSAFVGQMFFSKALQIDSVAKVTPIIFLQVIFAFVNDFFLFDFSPEITSVLGAICVGFSVYVSTIGK